MALQGAQDNAARVSPAQSDKRINMCNRAIKGYRAGAGSNPDQMFPG